MMRGGLTGPPMAPRRIASAFFAAWIVVSVTGTPWTSIEHWKVCQNIDSRPLKSEGTTYASKEVVLQIELDL